MKRILLSLGIVGAMVIIWLVACQGTPLPTPGPMTEHSIGRGMRDMGDTETPTPTSTSTSTITPTTTSTPIPTSTPTATLTPTSTPTASRTSTPTSTPCPGYGTGTCWITEIFSKQMGGYERDYNLRRGAGTDDQFVEIACNPPQSIAGWRLDFGTTLTYTIAADNWTGPLKVFWLDLLAAYTTTTTVPLTDTVTLRNVQLTPVATRTYQTLADGLSYAATAWTNPGGTWWYYAPSPGWGGEYAP